MKIYVSIILIALIAISCGSSSNKQKASDEKSNTVIECQKLFLKNLGTLCGKSFSGKELFTKPGRTSWADKKLVMYVNVCDSNKVYIPFHIDNDHSRTWMFIFEQERLRFRHDHRHEDGTPEDVTLYGGYADSTGTAYNQSFPWDEYTQNLLADGNERKWSIVLSEDLSTFTYQLYYKGELVFAAEFDLKNPLYN